MERRTVTVLVMGVQYDEKDNKTRAQGILKIGNKNLPWNCTVENRYVVFTGELEFPKMEGMLKDAVLNTMGHVNVPHRKQHLVEVSR